MIHHISIAVNQPLHVAEVLSQVLMGTYVPFPSHPESYIVLADDAYGTAIELLPRGTELIPDKTAATFSQNSLPSPFHAVHAAISVPSSREKIEDLGVREGWLVRQCDRGPFSVIEFWVENQLMLELLPPELASQYLDAMQPQNWRAFVATTSVGAS